MRQAQLEKSPAERIFLQTMHRSNCVGVTGEFSDLQEKVFEIINVRKPEAGFQQYDAADRITEIPQSEVDGKVLLDEIKLRLVDPTFTSLSFDGIQQFQVRYFVVDESLLHSTASENYQNLQWTR